MNPQSHWMAIDDNGQSKIILQLQNRCTGVEMTIKVPKYLLLTAANSNEESLNRGGTWSFILQQFDSDARIEIEDYEPNVRGERLQLLAVVRGLEALEQPANVTLVTGCKYVGRGIRQHLPSWREKGWQWERYGEMVAVKNSDLWKRIDRAMSIHQVTCRIWSINSARELAANAQPWMDSAKTTSTPESTWNESETTYRPGELIAATKFNFIQAVHAVRTKFRRTGYAGKYGFSG